MGEEKKVGFLGREEWDTGCGSAEGLWTYDIHEGGTVQDQRLKEDKEHSIQQNRKQHTDGTLSTRPKFIPFVNVVE